MFLETEVKLFAQCSTELELVNELLAPVQKLVFARLLLCMQIKFENGAPNEAIVLEWAATNALRKFEKAVLLVTKPLKDG